MDKWIVYSTLKTKRNIFNALKKIELLEAEEVKEGVIEYLYMVAMNQRLEEKGGYKIGQPKTLDNKRGTIFKR